MQTPEQRREYYKKNKEKWKTYSFVNLSKEKQQELIEYQRNYRQLNKELVLSKTRAKRTARITEAIELLGGKCSHCCNVFDSVVYDFHHLDPSQKDFTISQGMLLGKQRFFAEVKKCILLCANCHRLAHKRT